MKENLVRAAAPEDLAAIVRLARENRSLLAQLEPTYWRKAENADEFHAIFLEWLIKNPDVTKRVLLKGDEVVGFAVSNRHPTGWWFIDDVCLLNQADWATDGVDLFRAIEERPAFMTAPHLDEVRVAAARQAGLQRISVFRSVHFSWELVFDLGGGGAEQLQSPAALADAPFHVFSPAMTAESIAVVGDDVGGYAVLSPSIAPPPIYDVGGKVAVIDRVVAGDRESALIQGLNFASARGDVGAILVIEEQDAELNGIADRLGFRHPVDVFKWPGQA